LPNSIKPHSEVGLKSKSCWEKQTNYETKNNVLQSVMTQHQFSGFWNGCVPSSPWEVDVEKGLIEITGS